MKPLLIVFLLAGLLSSCKKTYQCNCTTTLTYKLNTGGYNTEVYPNTSEDYGEKLSKKQAKASCDHQKEAVQKSFTNAWTNNGMFPLENGESIKTECALTN